jgi:putative transcriptional regulator
MTKRRKFKSDMSEAIHQSAAMLHKAGALDEAMMRDFNARHLAVEQAKDVTIPPES